jgi:hypothetical protein
MQVKYLKSISGWSAICESKKFVEHIPGTPYSAFGIALLFYVPERRLSISIWSSKFSKNIRLWGPHKLRWEE